MACEAERGRDGAGEAGRPGPRHPREAAGAEALAGVPRGLRKRRLPQGLPGSRSLCKRDVGTRPQRRRRSSVPGLSPWPLPLECLRNSGLNVGPLCQPARPARPADTALTSGLAFGPGLPGTREAAPSKYLSSRVAVHNADATRKTSAGSSPGGRLRGSPGLAIPLWPADGAGCAGSRCRL